MKTLKEFLSNNIENIPIVIATILIIVLLFSISSCTNENIEPVTDKDSSEIVQYRFQTFLIEVDYSKELQGGKGQRSPAFTLIEYPKEAIFRTNFGYYKPDLYFKAPSIPDWTVFTIRGIYARQDSIGFKTSGLGMRYLIRVEK